MEQAFIHWFRGHFHKTGSRIHIKMTTILFCLKRYFSVMKINLFPQHKKILHSLSSSMVMWLCNLCWKQQGNLNQVRAWFLAAVLSSPVKTRRSATRLQGRVPRRLQRKPGSKERSNSQAPLGSAARPGPGCSWRTDGQDQGAGRPAPQAGALSRSRHPPDLEASLRDR